jgi:DNA-binding NarL/FixJ family response regulator
VLLADFDVVNMVSNGHLLVEAAFELRPDVIVTDISMPIKVGSQVLSPRGRVVRCICSDIIPDEIVVLLQLRFR